MRGYPPTLCLGSWRAAIRLDILNAVKFALGLCYGSRGYVNIVGLVQFGFHSNKHVYVMMQVKLYLLKQSAYSQSLGKLL